jgi:hypothetical protein
MVSPPPIRWGEYSLTWEGRGMGGDKTYLTWKKEGEFNMVKIGENYQNWSNLTRGIYGDFNVGEIKEIKHGDRGNFTSGR